MLFLSEFLPHSLKEIAKPKGIPYFIPVWLKKATLDRCDKPDLTAKDKFIFEPLGIDSI